jgi:hypothetical protein
MYVHLFENGMTVMYIHILCKNCEKPTDDRWLRVPLTIGAIPKCPKNKKSEKQKCPKTKNVWKPKCPKTKNVWKPKVRNLNVRNQHVRNHIFLAFWTSTFRTCWFHTFWFRALWFRTFRTFLFSDSLPWSLTVVVTLKHWPKDLSFTGLLYRIYPTNVEV